MNCYSWGYMLLLTEKIPQVSVLETPCCIAATLFGAPRLLTYIHSITKLIIKTAYNVECT